MAVASIKGSDGQVYTVDFGSSSDATLGIAVADALASGIAAGTTRSQVYGAAQLSGPNVLFVTAAVSGGLPPTTTGIVIANNVSATLIGTGALGESVLSGQGGLTLNTGGGSGTIVAGGGNNFLADHYPTPVSTMPASSGGFLFATGSGNDTILASVGDNTVVSGLGANLIALGGGNNIDVSAGTDTILAGSGSATVAMIGANGGLVFGAPGSYGNNSELLFFGSAGSSTVVGGGLYSSESLFGGAGGGFLEGGAGGNNLLVAGVARTTLFGGGLGDTLIASSAGGDVLVGASAPLVPFNTGALMDGALSSEGNIFFAGASLGNEALGFSSSTDYMFGGSGADTFFASSGLAVMSGGGGANTYVFNQALTEPNFDSFSITGGITFIEDFDGAAGDRIALQGYGGNVAAALFDAGGYQPDFLSAVSGHGPQLTETINPVTPVAQVVAGSTYITLPDLTKIVLVGMTNLSASDFV